jgi:hypothetical protein
MKVAIPTSDGLMLDCHSKDAKGLMVLTISTDKVVNEEMHWIPKTCCNHTTENFLKESSGCDYIIVSETDQDFDKVPKMADKEMIKTGETIIINIVNEFVSEMLRRESNYCCCP